jgi:RNA polymerase sigma factor (sigma-70 family)
LPPTARVEPASYTDRADEWLVERCRQSAAEGHDGDDSAFAELVRRYRGRVFRLAVSILGQEFAPEAEDVAQDVMLRVHHALRSFRGEAKFGSWIYRIAFNQALNVKARTRYRAPHVSDQALATTPSQDRGPYDQLQDDRRHRAVLACVDELPEVYPVRFAPALLAGCKHERNRGDARCAGEHREVVPPPCQTAAARHAYGTRFRCTMTN